MQNGEPGIEGVTVEINCGNFTDTEETDVNGNYLFSGVPSFMFCSVSADDTTVPFGLTLGQCPESIDVNLNPSEVVLVADLCFANATDAIGDTVFIIC